MFLDFFLGKVLIPALERNGVPPDTAGLVAQDMALRLRSILSRWSDLIFRQTLLVIGREEGTFYRPLSADLEVRSLVVVAIRNSALEDISSVDDAAKQYGLTTAIKLDESMPDITGSAINCLESVGIGALQSMLELPFPESDPFGRLAETYPAAWEALSQLCNPTVVKRTYLPVAPNGELPLISLSSEVEGANLNFTSVVCSGMDASIDPSMRGVLKEISSGDLQVLFIPSFKHLTRNARKLLELIEFAFFHNAAVVSPNYYLSNGYVARREPLLRPIHSNKELRSTLQQALVGCKTLHRKTLEKILLSLDASP